jgi:hypothetical protein
MSLRRRLAVSLLVAIGPMSSTTRSTADQSLTISMADALSYYELGEFDVVSRALAAAGGGDVQHFLPEWKKQAAGWIAADGPEAEPRRRLVAATFALEIGHAAMDVQWEMTRQVTEWACTLLRDSGPPTEEERKWDLAALALLEGSFEPVRPDTVRAHLAHIRARFPNEPRVALGDALLHEYDYWVSRTVVSGTGPFATIVHDESTARLGIPSLLEAARQPANRPEAELRLGYLEYARDNLDAAMPHLAAAAEGDDDPTRVYLANLFMGWADRNAGRHEEAQAAFRRALSAVEGLSAALALGAELYAVDRRDEADDFVEAALVAGRTVPDPWKQYGYGDLRRWPGLIEELREMIQ